MSTWKENNSLNRLKSHPTKRFKEAQKLSYKLEDGKVLNFYSDENFPASVNSLPYRNELELYERIFLSISLRFYKVYDIDEYNSLKKEIYSDLIHTYQYNILIDDAEEMLEYMNEAFEEVEYGIKAGSIYFKRGDDIIIKDCISEMTNLIQAIKNRKVKENYESKLKSDRSKHHLLEYVTNKPFNRILGQKIIEPYKNYYKNLDFEQNYIDNIAKFGEPNYTLHSVSYDKKSKTLKIDAEIGFKTYGNPHDERCTYTADRDSYHENTFIFDKPLSYDLADIIYPINLVKCGSGYPTRSFYYTEYCYYSKRIKPNKLYWVDHIILDVMKTYD